MAQFLRGKQAGIQKDLSEGLSPELFALDDVRLLRLGIPGNFFFFDNGLTYCDSSSNDAV
jgi:hypothetical protein